MTAPMVDPRDRKPIIPFHVNRVSAFEKDLIAKTPGQLWERVAEAAEAKRMQADNRSDWARAMVAYHKAAELYPESRSFRDLFQYGAGWQRREDKAEMVRLYAINEQLAGQVQVAEADQRIEAWREIVQHPFFRECYDTEGTLLDAMLEKLSVVTTQRQTAQEEGS